MFDSFLCQAVFRLETGQISYKQKKIKILNGHLGKLLRPNLRKSQDWMIVWLDKKNVLAPNTTSGLALAVLKTTKWKSNVRNN